MTTATAKPLRVGQWVEYHGSLTQFHGFSYKVDYIGPEGNLILLPGSTSLPTMANVRPTSVTPIG